MPAVDQRSLIARIDEDWALLKRNVVGGDQVRAKVLHAFGRSAESDDALAGLIDSYAGALATHIAGAMAYRGEPDDAFSWLERDVVNQEDVSWVVSGREFAGIHGDPRWLPFLRGIGRAPEQPDAISFEVKLPQEGDMAPAPSFSRKGVDSAPPTT